MHLILCSIKCQHAHMRSYESQAECGPLYLPQIRSEREACRPTASSWQGHCATASDPTGSRGTGAREVQLKPGIHSLPCRLQSHRSRTASGSGVCTVWAVCKIHTTNCGSLRATSAGIKRCGGCQPQSQLQSWGLCTLGSASGGRGAWEGGMETGGVPLGGGVGQGWSLEGGGASGVSALRICRGKRRVRWRGDECHGSQLWGGEAFLPLPSLVLRSFQNGAISSAGRRGQGIHGGGTLW